LFGTKLSEGCSGAEQGIRIKATREKKKTIKKKRKKKKNIPAVISDCCLWDNDSCFAEI
jgi:hypothetical protein